MIYGVVLAAGGGTRLQPVSLSRPKATVPVCGRLLIERVLDALAEAGCEKFVIVVGDPGDAVADVCRAWAGRRPLAFAVQTARRGMAHALLQAAPQLDARFVLSACDSLVPPGDVAALVGHHERLGAAATLSLLRVPDPVKLARSGVVAWDGTWIRRIIEKAPPGAQPSDVASLPLYVFEQEFVELLPQVKLSPRGELELQDAIAELIARTGRVTGRLSEQRWQVTTADDLRVINQQFLALGETREDARAVCLPPVHVGAGAQLGAGVRLGPDAVVEDGAVIGDGAVVRRAVVLRDAVVPAGAVVEDEVVAPEAVSPTPAD